MRPPIPEDIEHKTGGSLDDGRLPEEVGGRRHVAGEAYNLFDSVQIGDDVLNFSQAVERREPRRTIAAPEKRRAAG